MINSYFDDIARYLDLVAKEYDVYIMIHDFDGFLKNYVNDFPIEYGEPNGYCTTILGDAKALKDCLEKQLVVLEKCNKGKAFYGMCHAGLETLTVPIKGEKKALGFIEAGKFCTNPQEAAKRRQNMADTYGFNPSVLDRDFNRTIRKKPADMVSLEIKLTAAANMLSMLCEKMVLDYEIQKQITDKASFCRHIEKYIELNYMSDLNIDVLSKFFSCSPSTITHTFKKYNGTNIKAYINQVRVEKAKEKLRQSNAAVSVIAKKVGITDANYFSKVFRSICGVSPSDYQKAAKAEKHNSK